MKWNINGVKWEVVETTDQKIFVYRNGVFFDETSGTFDALYTILDQSSKYMPKLGEGEIK